MLDNIRKTAKHTIIYSLGNLSTKLIGFVLLPLYTKNLSVFDYGVLGILESSSQFLIAVFGFRLSTSMLRWCSDEKDENIRKSIVFTTLVSLLFILIFLDSFLIPLRSWFSELFFGNLNYSNYFTILFLSASIGILNHIPLELIRFKEKSLFYITINSLKLVTILTLNIYFITVLKIGVLGIILSQLIGSSLLMILVIPFVLKNIEFKFSFRIFIEMFKYGFPLIFSTISTMLLSLGDRYIIRYLKGFSDVGLYTLGYRIASVINVFILQSFSMGFLPIAFKMYDKPEAKRFFSKILTYFVMFLIFSVLGLSFFSKEIIKTFALNKDYWLSYTIVPILSLTFVFKGMQYVFSLGFHYTKKTKYNAYIIFVGLVINLILNFIFIPKYNIYGAACSTVVSSLTITLLFYYFSQKVYFIKYELGKITKLFMTGFFLFGISIFIQDLTIILRILVKFTLLIAFPIILRFWNFFNEIELVRIKQAWKKWTNFGKFIENVKKIKF